jgi:hypothetical protein
MQAAIAQQAPFTKRGKQPVNPRANFLIFDESREASAPKHAAANPRASQGHVGRNAM